MKPREAAEIRRERASRQWSIPSKLTLMVTPLAVVAILVGLLLAWNLLTAEPVGFSWSDGLAIALAVVVLAAVGGTLLAFHLAGRSMADRIGEVSAAARRVARKDLVELLEVLRNPDPDLSSITPVALDVGAGDEVGDLARSFDELHNSLIEVGARQMETMRAGVSSIFVTLARRNSSLVDRQLALLDELEAREEEPVVLGGFYQLDHLATRMRRNAESLLVLAGSESPRVWAKATDMSDVVRGAVSEIDEYQRIEVLALEPARLSGGAVSDVGHLVAELLENAIQFSPPSEVIRVTGLFDMGGYQLAVSDRGVGMSDARLAEMNRILARPPALGLSVEPTLGLYVVAKLAHRHGLDVDLIRGVPGITARITIPRDHLEVDRETVPRPYGADDTERVVVERAKVTAEVEDTDAETRAYVRNQSKEPEAVDESDQVVDLTAPGFSEPGFSEPGLDEPAVGLPVRRPGLSFIEDDEDAPAVSAGDAAARIKAALSDYDRGRRSAADTEDADTSHMWDDSDWEASN